MIGRISGVLAALDDNNALVDVNGVGYDVVIPRRVGDRLLVGESLVLHTHVTVVNDVQQLYGFDSMADRTVFRKLLGVSRLGPKTAAALISELSGEEIAAAIEAQESRVLASVPGIGKKSSETIVFALRDDVSKWGLTIGDSVHVTAAPTASSVRGQAISALRALGFQRIESEDAVDQAHEDGLDVSALTQRALRLIGTKA